MTAVGYGVLALVCLYAVAVLESWAWRGRFQLLAPVYSAMSLMGREAVVPRKSDRGFYEVAPALLLAAGVLAALVLPLAPGRVVIDLYTGALWVNAALVYVAVALVMAGWAPNGAYAMVGGWRFLGQLIAYSMLVVMPITAVAMRAQSLTTTAVVTSQADLWNVAAQPLGFTLFFLAAMALCFLPPFDLPDAPSELAGGVFSEYTGFRLATMRLARTVLVLTLSASVAVFFLGGWLGPGLPPWFWTALKTLAVAATMLFAGRYLPRIREAHMLEWGWKYGIPLALVNILWVGVTLLGVR